MAVKKKCWIFKGMFNILCSTVFSKEKDKVHEQTMFDLIFENFFIVPKNSATITKIYSCRKTRLQYKILKAFGKTIWEIPCQI